MNNFFEKTIELIIDKPYIYVTAFAIILVFLLLVLFKKEISKLLNRIIRNGVKVKKKEEIMLFSDSTDTDEENAKNEGVCLVNNEIVNSTIDSIEGVVNVEDSKIEGSRIGNIRSK